MRIRERVEGASVAPAMPRSAREAMSTSEVLENAANTDATPKAAAPIKSRRRRPILSPRVPMVSRNPASRNP